MSAARAGDDPVTLRELSNAVADLRTDVRDLRADLVRKDVYDAQVQALNDKVAELTASKRAVVAAVSGTLFTVVAGVVIFLLQRGLSGGV